MIWILQLIIGSILFQVAWEMQSWLLGSLTVFFIGGGIFNFIKAVTGFLESLLTDIIKLINILR